MAQDDETGIDPVANDGEPDNDLATARARRAANGGNGGGSMADRGAEVGDGDDDDDGEPLELPLNIPGAKKARTTMRKGTKRVAVEGKLMGAAVRQLNGVVDDPDQLVELRVLARLDHNTEVPVRQGTGETAQTESIIVRQHFRPISIEVLTKEQPATGTG